MIKAFVSLILLLSYVASLQFGKRYIFTNHFYKKNRINVFQNYATKKLTPDEPLTDELTSNDASFVRINVPSIHGPPNNISRRPLQRDDPSAEDIVSADELSGAQFGSIFTQCAPYIAQHRGSVMVLHIPSKMFLPENKDLFDLVMDDISLLHLLGVQIVLVAGVRELLDQRIRQATNMSVAYHNGMRVTDDRTMHILKELSGSVRFEVESALGRGFRGAASSQHGAIDVVSGNLFYSAKPVGVRNGIDFRLSGEVRKIETENVRRRLEGGDVVLLTSLGHSHSGEVFNVPSELLAAECGAKLKASKVIFLTEGEYLTDARTGRVIQSLRLAIR